MFSIFVFLEDTATNENYTYGHTLSLHDALPIYTVAETDRLPLRDQSGRTFDHFAKPARVAIGQGAQFSEVLVDDVIGERRQTLGLADRKSTRLNSSH